jgi:hypothetical protein
LTLTPDELARLKQHETYEGATYKVFDTRNDDLKPDDKGYQPRPEVEAVKEGRYLVDPATGRLRILRDDTIMGKLDQRDDGTPVERKFDAPKTQVMGIVINGVLEGKLNWSMVAIGAMIALMLELCGVSALAFAVGVYVPIQYSAPIFLGGIVRYLVDKRLARQAHAEIAGDSNDPEVRARAEIEAIRRSETSSGVLLASGYIAGGSLAGVLVAFLAFSDEIPRDLSKWQHRQVAIGQAMPFEQAAAAVAERELGVDRRSEQDPKRLQRADELAREIVALSKNETPYYWVRVPGGTELKLPKNQSAVAASDMTLAQFAAEHLGRDWKAKQVFDLNSDRLKLPAELPPEATLKVPQPSWPAVLVFAGVALFLWAVGGGLLMRGGGDERTEGSGEPPASR